VANTSTCGVMLRQLQHVMEQKYMPRNRQTVDLRENSKDDRHLSSLLDPDGEGILAKQEQRAVKKAMMDDVSYKASSSDAELE
jgi:hypothetical protein